MPWMTGEHPLSFWKSLFENNEQFCVDPPGHLRTAQRKDTRVDYPPSSEHVQEQTSAPPRLPVSVSVFFYLAFLLDRDEESKIARQ